MKKKIGILLLVVLLVGGALGIQARLRFDYEDYLRLHVLANSDSGFDQRLKIAVRDQIIHSLTPLFAGVQDAETARKITQAHLSFLVQEAQEVVRQQGYAYTVTAELGEFTFPQRQYENLWLPAGVYQALRVKIGQGAGHNWWCVLYPPLCLAANGQGLTTIPQQQPTFRFWIKEKLTRRKEKPLPAMP